MKKFNTYDVKLDFDDVLIEPSKSSEPLTRKGVDIEIDWLDTTTCPVAISNMVSTGTYKIANIATDMHILTFLHKEYTAKEHLANLANLADRRYIAITSGVQPWDIKKTIEVFTAYPDIGMINVDIANVYANVEGMKRTIAEYRKRFPHAQICAGNIAKPDLIKELVSAGADYVKVGVGSGAACKTRSEVGVGVPQVSAVLECALEARHHGVKVISDGGCVTAGDVCKAICAGADIVMIAGMVSKCEECDNVIEIDGKKYVNFYGLGSTKMYNLTSPTEQEYRPNEGRDLLIPVKGPLKAVLSQVQGGLRSLCTYIGVKHIKMAFKTSKFVRVNNTINRSLERYEQ